MATKTLEKPVTDLETMIDDVPGFINARFTYIRAQLDTLDARASDRLDVRVSNLDAPVSSVEAKLDALPRVLAEMLDERDRRSGAK